MEANIKKELDQQVTAQFFTDGFQDQEAELGEDLKDEWQVGEDNDDNESDIS